LLDLAERMPDDPDPVKLALGLPQRLHLLGAGGAGLSGAARLLHARGHVLSGHDRESSPFSSGLERLGIPITIGESVASDLPGDVQAIVRTAAVSNEDPQLLAARARGLGDFKYADVLPLLAAADRTLAVAGTHGKTTSTWMLHHALLGVARANSAPGAEAPRPGALVGGIHKGLGTNALVPEPEGWFAVEACEYDRTFLHLRPAGGIVTNLEPDHLDYYGSMPALEEAFARFADRVHPDGLLVVGEEVPDKLESAARCEVWRLGRELHVELLSESRGFFQFRLRGPGWATPPLQLGVPGSFNVANAALALGLAVGTSLRGGPLGSIASEVASAAARSLESFDGVSRRFESWGTVGGVAVVHDYAHHPTEVSATLEAARRVLPGRSLHVLFQPHQHSRTARFLAGFVESLRRADRVVIADVYGARAHIDDQDAGAPELVMRLRRAGVDAYLGGPALDAGYALVDGLEGDCAALILGAGDVDRIRDDFLDRLAVRGPASR